MPPPRPFYRRCYALVNQVRCESSARKVFRTCVASLEDGTPGWLPLDSLYFPPGRNGNHTKANEVPSEPSPSSTATINTPNQLIFVARRGLRCQVFDAEFWEHLYQRTVELRDDFLPRQWVEIVHIYKRIKVRKPGLMDMATRELLYQLERLPLEDLSKLALSFAYHHYIHGDMFSRIAEVVTTRLQRQYMNRKPEEACPEAGEPSKNNPLSKLTSYTHLVGAFAKCNHPQKELFQAVADEIIQCLTSGEEVLVPPRFLVKILASYARFGYRHSQLFDTLCKEMVTAKLSSEELLQIQSMMKALEYENDIMLHVLAYRLGNAEIAKPSQNALISQ